MNTLSLVLSDNDVLQLRSSMEIEDGILPA